MRVDERFALFRCQVSKKRYELAGSKNVDASN